MLEEVTSQNKIIQKICVISVLLFITIIFIWSRTQVIQSHFAHYDDLYIGYAFSIIDNYSPTFFKDQLTKYGGGIGMIIGDKTFDLFSEFPKIFTIFKRFLAPFAISKMSTYAPMQYFISAITVDLDTSYARSIITPRLSSTIFSILALFVFFYFSKNFEKDTREDLLLIGSLILTLSWMFLIYSSQSGSYASGIFAVSCLFLIYIKNFNRTLSLKQSFFWGIIISLLVLTNYQTLFFLPGFYLALFFCANFSFRKFLSNWFICGLINSGFTIVTFFYFINNRAIEKHMFHFMAGPKFQYLFNANNICDERGFLRCTFEFFSNNFFEVLQSLVSFSNLSGFTSKFYTTSLVILILFGLIYIITNKSKHINGLAIFIIVTFIVWIVLIFNQLLTFSPTRHSLVLLVLMSILASFGFSFIRLIIPAKIRFYSTYLVITFVVCFSITYLYNFSEQKNKRIDPFQTINIQSLVEDKNVSTIVTYGWTLNLFFFPEIKQNFIANIIPGSSSTIIFKRKEISDQVKNTMFISHRADPDLSGSYNVMEKAAKFLPIINKTPLENHNLIYSHETKSRTEIGYGDLTRGGSNNLIIKIFQTSIQ